MLLLIMGWCFLALQLMFYRIGWEKEASVAYWLVFVTCGVNLLLN